MPMAAGRIRRMVSSRHFLGCREDKPGRVRRSKFCKRGSAMGPTHMPGACWAARHARRSTNGQGRRCSPARIRCTARSEATTQIHRISFCARSGLPRQSVAMRERYSAAVRLRQRRIVRVSLGAAAIERRLVGCVQRCALLQPLDQVGVGDERLSERDQVGRIGIELLVGEFEVIAVVGDIGLLEPLAQARRSRTAQCRADRRSRLR